jgi:antitoxin FitA
MMVATLLVREVDEAVVERLEARARAHGRTAEAEHRAILEQALSLPAAPEAGKDAWTLLSSGPKADLDIPDLHEEVRPASFD